MLGHLLAVQVQVLVHHQVLAGVLLCLLGGELERHLGGAISRVRREGLLRRDARGLTRRGNPKLTLQLVFGSRLQVLVRHRVNHSATRQRQHLLIRTINSNRRPDLRISRLTGVAGVSAGEPALEGVVVQLATAI